MLTRAINWDLITREYDQMIKYARVGFGRAEAVTAPDVPGQQR